MRAVVMDLLKEKMRSKKRQEEEAFKWNKAGCKKQFDFNCKSRDLLCDELQWALEDTLGADKLPAKVEDLIKEGRKLIDDRNHCLRIADEYGFEALEHFEKDDLARDEKEEKKLKKIKKEQKEKQEKKDAKKFKSTYGRRDGFSKQRSGGGDRYDLEFGSGGVRSNVFSEFGKGSKVKTHMKGLFDTLCPGTSSRTKMTKNVSSAASSATSPGTAGVASNQVETKMIGPEEERETNHMKHIIKVNDHITVNKSDNVKEIEFFNDLDNLKKLDGFENGLVNLVEREHVYEIFEEESIESKVHNTLYNHLGAWKEAGAGGFATGVIENGFKLSLFSTPEKYQEKNNQSFFKEEQFAVEAVLKMAQIKVLREVQSSEVLCVNPLSVATNSKGKRRLCIDLSRHVNEKSVARKFRIESTKAFLEVVNKGDFMYGYDLKSAFHQIPIFKPHQKYLGLCVNINGEKRYFVFNNLPFGYNDAVRALTKLLRFPLERWRQDGGHHFIHVDDGIGAMSGEKKAQAMAGMVKKDLEYFGLLTSDDKCQWKVTQELEWTGLRINTKEFKVYIPDWKLEKAEGKLDLLLVKLGQLVPVKELASVVGLIISFGLGMGRACRFYTRFSSMQVAKVSREQGWKSNILLEEETVRELRFWRLNMKRLNGQMIRKAPGVKVMRPRELYSDAGGFMAGGGRVENKKVFKDTVFQVHLTPEEVEESSTFRELRGIEEGIRAVGPGLRGSRVRWHCDNWAACKITELGSMKRKCMEVAARIQELVGSFELEFEIVWQRRTTEEIRFADFVSKDFDFGDYKICDNDFYRLEQEYGGFEADYFASSYSYRMKPYYSRYLSGESAGSDAFSQDWGRGFGYFHPPVALVARVLAKAKEDKARGLLLVPDWPGSMMLTELRSYSRHHVVARGSFRPYFECPVWFENNTFRGWPQFDLLVYELNF